MGRLLRPLSRSPQDILRRAPPYGAGAWSRARHQVFLQPSTSGWRKPRARRHPQGAEGRRGLANAMGCSRPPVWAGQNCRWGFRVRKPSVKWLGRGQCHSPRAGSWKVPSCDIASHRGEESAAPGESEEPQNQPLPRAPPTRTHAPQAPPASALPLQTLQRGPAPARPPDPLGPWGTRHHQLRELRPRPVPGAREHTTVWWP